MKRYYYKKGNAYFNLLEPAEIEGATEITETEFNEHQEALYHNPHKEKLNRIHDLKAQLEKCKEDVEQVELFGMERTDYEYKKEQCRALILELRKLEKGE
jgi:superfamily II RNA helicase